MYFNPFTTLTIGIAILSGSVQVIATEQTNEITSPDSPHLVARSPYPRKFRVHCRVDPIAMYFPEAITEALKLIPKNDKATLDINKRCVSGPFRDGPTYLAGAEYCQKAPRGAGLKISCIRVKTKCEKCGYRAFNNEVRAMVSEMLKRCTTDNWAYQHHTARAENDWYFVEITSGFSCRYS